LPSAKHLLHFALIASFCHFFGAFVALNSAAMSAAPILNFDLEGVEILAKMMQNAKRKQMFGTGAKFSTGATFIPVLHLARCQLNVMNVPQY